MFNKIFAAFFSTLLVSLFAAGGSAIAAATDVGSLNALAAETAGSPEFLDPDVAFRLEATPEGPDQVRMRRVIAARYYLYPARINV